MKPYSYFDEERGKLCVVLWVEEARIQKLYPDEVQWNNDATILELTYKTGRRLTIRPGARPLLIHYPPQG